MRHWSVAVVAVLQEDWKADFIWTEKAAARTLASSRGPDIFYRQGHQDARKKDATVFFR